MTFRIQAMLAAVIAASGVVAPRLALGQAQSAPDLLLADWKKGQHVDLSSETFVEPNRDVDDGSSTRFSLTRSLFRARLMDDREINPTLGIQSTHIELGGTPMLPKQLDDLNASIASPIIGDDKWFIGGSIGVGYAGDNAFGQGNAYYLLGSIMYGMSLDNGDHLLLLVDYNGNRTIFPDIPIPSIAYHSTPNKHIEYTLGIPYADLTVRPNDQWRLTINYQFPSNTAAEVGYRPLPEVELFGRFISDQYAFHTADQPSTRRLFYEESRAEAGITWDACENASLTLAGGYAFERSFSTGFDDRDLENLTNVEDGIFARFAFDVSF